MALVTAVTFVSLALVFAQGLAENDDHAEMSFSTLVRTIGEGRVKAASIPMYGGNATVVLSDGTAFQVVVPAECCVLADKLTAAGAEVSYRKYEEFRDANETAAATKSQNTPRWIELLFDFLPFIVFVVFFAVVMFLSRKGNAAYYSRAEKLQADFFSRMEKLLIEMKRDA